MVDEHKDLTEITNSIEDQETLDTAQIQTTEGTKDLNDPLTTRSHDLSYIGSRTLLTITYREG